MILPASNQVDSDLDETLDVLSIKCTTCGRSILWHHTKGDVDGVVCPARSLRSKRSSPAILSANITPTQIQYAIEVLSSWKGGRGTYGLQGDLFE